MLAGRVNKTLAAGELTAVSAGVERLTGTITTTSRRTGSGNTAGLTRHTRAMD